MPFFRISALLLSIAMLISLNGCDSGTESNSNISNTANNVLTESSNSANTNPEQLNLLIKIPYEADDLIWKEFSSPRRIVAVFRFYPDDTAKLMETAVSEKTPTPITISSETWFPDELIAQSESDGPGDTLKGTAYGAGQFLQPPFNEGRLIRIDGTDFIILEASVR